MSRENPEPRVRVCCATIATMASTAVTVVPRRDAIRDPVLLLPAAVAAGLAIGWLGIHDHVSGTRIAADLALAWSLVAAALVALERPRWRAATRLLGAGCLRAPRRRPGVDEHTRRRNDRRAPGLVVGGAPRSARADVSRGPPVDGAARVVVPAAYAAAAGGQIVLAFASANAHAAHRAQEIAALAVGAAVLGLVAPRLLTLQGPGRRAQAPLLVAAAVSAATSVAIPRLAPRRRRRLRRR